MTHHNVLGAAIIRVPAPLFCILECLLTDNGSLILEAEWLEATGESLAKDLLRGYSEFSTCVVLVASGSPILLNVCCYLPNARRFHRKGIAYFKKLCFFTDY